MKHVVKKIAMILIIVMIANCFTGCAEWVAAGASAFVHSNEFKLVCGITIVVAVIGIIVLIVSETSARNKKLGPKDTSPIQIGSDTLNSKINSMSKEEIDYLTKAFYSLPNKELNLFIDRLCSLSEKESISLMDSINSYSAQELSAIVETVNSMSETEKITSIETVNSLPKTASMTYFVQNIEVDVSEKKVSLEQSLN